MSEQSGASAVLRLVELAGEPRIERILIDHALRGLRIQVLLRVLLAVFALGAIALEPPAQGALACAVIVTLYVVWCGINLFVIPRAGIAVLRRAWLAAFVDLAALTALTVVASGSDRISWSADVLVSGFAVVPMIAATVLLPRVCACVVVPTVIVYAAATVVARGPNGEPWSLIILRTFVMATLAVAAYLLCRLQRSRVETIGTLAAQRAALLDDLMLIEKREREALAEELHDGALQYVLAARQELDSIRATGDAGAIERVEQALRESARLLRSTVAELHPAVLEQRGLPAALGALVESAGKRAGHLGIALDTEGWPQGLRTAHDGLLFATARELLTNVVKHARATSVEVTLEAGDGLARLVVLDDGVGFDQSRLDERVGAGHIGLVSRRVRIEGVGGSLTVAAGRDSGTVAIATIPAT